MTIRPQAATAVEAMSRPNPARRISISPAARAAVVTSLCAALLHLAFPRAGAWWLIPFALAGLYATWSTLPPRAAALNGYLGGLVFFVLSFDWFGETAGKLLGGFGFIIDLGPAVAEAPAFALTALVASLAARRCAPALAPLVAAAAFTAAEWARSSGVLGVPLAGLQLPLVESPLRPLAAFAGGYGLTFAGALAAAYLAAAVRAPRLRPVCASVLGAIALAAAAAWVAWPARTLAPPELTVAAVQGNIRQEIKGTADARLLAIERYTAMTEALAPQHPAFVLWPETVILADLSTDVPLRLRFGLLAHRLGTNLGVGGFVRDPRDRAVGNGLVFFGPDGAVRAAVTKRQLVPFAEWIPGPEWLRALPFADEIGRLAPGHGPQVDPALGVGTLICWESVFGDLAAEQVEAGARFFVVATDDAWFGHSDGPYQHAQATTLRAVETGRWIVRAAATGFSGIVAPDGTWRERSGLETQETIVGKIGAPVETPYPRIGPLPVAALMIAIVAFGFLPTPRRAR